MTESGGVSLLHFSICFFSCSACPPPSALRLLLSSLRFDCMIFMNSRTTEAYTVSCKSGNKNTFFFWTLFCLVPKFLGVPIAYISFISFKAVDRSPAVAII
ncbi:hypothetical protein V6N13_038765 [Hibiscus sabdariffa]